MPGPPEPGADKSSPAHQADPPGNPQISHSGRGQPHKDGPEQPPAPTTTPLATRSGGGSGGSTPQKHDRA